ncbi:helix-turn-helix domain-containing protein [Ancylobacter sp. 6x-1]|uniref:Helix-turn-helix domain-containing protein n=1 Tax=Ancylobacter crimeensis TaxID=2579147 RepID=A0ABT0DAB5_9HYPH|nr:helix-turn-helix domain-containing protein [Ancylobacter crimeensis]MCK0196897.1 helix-turn-helix domain-containing protein [Ancylobacter crimeensis]
MNKDTGLTMVKIVSDGDVLYGASAIAEFLGLPPKHIYYRVSVGDLPTFRLGAIICARRSTLHAWMAQQEGTVGTDHSRAGMMEPRG